MWDLKCIVAAICFTTSNILFIVHGAFLYKSHHTGQDDGSSNSGFSFNTWKQLDPSYIEERWEVQRNERPILMCAVLFGILAWFSMMGPLVQSAWVLSRGGRRLVGPHVMLAMLAVCGGIIELLARLFYAGMMNASQWLAKDFNLDDWGGEPEGTGWRVLEMIHIVTRGMLLWVDAFEALTFFGIVVILFYSVSTERTIIKQTLDSERSRAENDNKSISVDGESSSDVGDEDESTTRQRQKKPHSSTPPLSAFAAVSGNTSTTLIIVKPSFTKRFVYFGLLIGIISLVDFIADVLRFVNWKLFERIAMATNIIVGVILLPIWLLCLAWQLPGATERFERAEGRAKILLDRYGNGEGAGLISKGDGGLS
mmetsp:Transcript_22002/g.46300  ORF Transcript_22002/g.46300 Transcript_22002/m.46300 type:complete len:368 (-) Transcript_22002:219-1322(-)